MLLLPAKRDLLLPYTTPGRVQDPLELVWHHGSIFGGEVQVTAMLLHSKY